MHADPATINSAAAAFVAGLITSLHCLGMCGPLACSLVPVRGDRADAQIVSTLYHLARLAAYAIIGALVGALGRLPLTWLGAGALRYAPWVLVVFFIAVAFRLDRFLPRLPLLGKAYLTVHTWGRARSPLEAAAALGLVTPLLPCGPLYLLFGVAMTTGSALRGVEFMLAFGLGTVPLLWLLQANFHWLRSKLPPIALARLQTGLALATALVIAWRLRGTLGPAAAASGCGCCH